MFASIIRNSRTLCQFWFHMSLFVHVVLGCLVASSEARVNHVVYRAVVRVSPGIANMISPFCQGNLYQVFLIQMSLSYFFWLQEEAVPYG